MHNPNNNTMKKKQQQQKKPAAPLNRNTFTRWLNNTKAGADLLRRLDEHIALARQAKRKPQLGFGMTFISYNPQVISMTNIVLDKVNAAFPIHYALHLREGVVLCGSHNYDALRLSLLAAVEDSLADA